MPKEAEQERVDWAKMRELEERLGAEREERTGLELEIQKLRQEREASEERRERQTGRSVTINSCHRPLTFLMSPCVWIMQMFPRRRETNMNTWKGRFSGTRSRSGPCRTGWTLSPRCGGRRRGLRPSGPTLLILVSILNPGV